VPLLAVLLCCPPPAVDGVSVPDNAPYTVLAQFSLGGASFSALDDPPAYATDSLKKSLVNMLDGVKAEQISLWNAEEDAAFSASGGNSWLTNDPNGFMWSTSSEARKSNIVMEIQFPDDGAQDAERAALKLESMQEDVTIQSTTATMMDKFQGVLGGSDPKMEIVAMGKVGLPDFFEIKEEEDEKEEEKEKEANTQAMWGKGVAGSVFGSGATAAVAGVQIANNRMTERIPTLEYLCFLITGHTNGYGPGGEESSAVQLSQARAQTIRNQMEKHLTSTEAVQQKGARFLVAGVGGSEEQGNAKSNRRCTVSVTNKQALDLYANDSPLLVAADLPEFTGHSHKEEFEGIVESVRREHKQKVLKFDLKGYTLDHSAIEFKEDSAEPTAEGKKIISALAAVIAKLDTYVDAYNAEVGKNDGLWVVESSEVKKFEIPGQDGKKGNTSEKKVATKNQKVENKNKSKSTAKENAGKEDNDDYDSPVDFGDLAQALADQDSDATIEALTASADDAWEDFEDSIFPGLFIKFLQWAHAPLGNRVADWWNQWCSGPLWRRTLGQFLWSISIGLAATAVLVDQYDKIKDWPAWSSLPISGIAPLTLYVVSNWPRIVVSLRHFMFKVGCLKSK